MTKYGSGVLAVGVVQAEAEETNEVGGGGEAAIGGLDQVAKHDEAGPLRGQVIWRRRWNGWNEVDGTERKQVEAARQHSVNTQEERGKSVGGGNERRELEVEARLDEAKESLPKTIRRYDILADVLAEHLRGGLEAAQEQHLDVVVVKARVSRVELRIGDGARYTEPLVKRCVVGMNVENGRRIAVPEFMVFGASGVGEVREVGGIGDDAGGAGKRSEGERHVAGC